MWILEPENKCQNTEPCLVYNNVKLLVIKRLLINDVRHIALGSGFFSRFESIMAMLAFRSKTEVNVEVCGVA